MLFFKIQTESECDGVENERWAKKKKETVAVISRGQKHFKKSFIFMKLTVFFQCCQVHLFQFVHELRRYEPMYNDDLVLGIF